MEPICLISQFSLFITAPTDSVISGDGVESCKYSTLYLPFSCNNDEQNLRVTCGNWLVFKQVGDNQMKACRGPSLDECLRRGLEEEEEQDKEDREHSNKGGPSNGTEVSYFELNTNQNAGSLRTRNSSI
jgi:hypothetical protein